MHGAAYNHKLHKLRVCCREAVEPWSFRQLCIFPCDCTVRNSDPHTWNWSGSFHFTSTSPPILWALGAICPVFEPRFYV